MVETGERERKMEEVRLAVKLVRSVMLVWRCPVMLSLVVSVN